MIKVYGCKKSSLDSVIKQLFLDFNLSKYKKVFIKPNLGGRYPIIKGENTDYNILDKICEIFSINNCEEIVIGHTSLLSLSKSGYDFKSLINNSKFYKLSKYMIVRFLNLDDAKRITHKVQGVDFNVPEIAKTHFYINLCSLKTHMETTVSLSLKNQVGLLSATERIRKHKVDLDGYIAYLGVAVRPDINIIDGRISMEGNGPHHGSPKRANMILCGDDMVEIDSLACRLVGIDFASVQHIKVAVENNVGFPVTEDIYNLYKDYFTKFRLPCEFYQKYFVLRVWPNKACSGCIFTLSDAHRNIRRDPIKYFKFILNIAKRGKIDIVLGKNAEANLNKYSQHVFAIGNCAEELTNLNKTYNFIPGCPPDKDSIMKFLLKR